MSEKEPGYKQLTLDEVRIIEAHQPFGAEPDTEDYERLTFLLYLEGGDRHTLTIESRAAHDLGVVQTVSEGDEGAQSDTEPVLIVPGRVFTEVEAHAVLSWPVDLLERFLVRQEPDHDTPQQGGTMSPREQRALDAAGVLVKKEFGGDDANPPAEH